jgi:formate transporter
VSYVGNLIGALLLAAIAVNSGIIAAPQSFIAVAGAKAALTFKQAFLRGILCNWLVCMAVYMAAGASDAGVYMHYYYIVHTYFKEDQCSTI